MYHFVEYSSSKSYNFNICYLNFKSKNSPKGVATLFFHFFFRKRSRIFFALSKTALTPFNMTGLSFFSFCRSIILVAWSNPLCFPCFQKAELLLCILWVVWASSVKFQLSQLQSPQANSLIYFPSFLITKIDGQSPHKPVRCGNFFSHHFMASLSACFALTANIILNLTLL